MSSSKLFSRINHQPDVIFLDFAKKFCKVSHKMLAKKLQPCGIRGQILTRIEACFSDRRQKDGMGDKHSSSTTVLSKVSEGSVLGSLLFIPFINDFNDEISLKIS